MKPAVRTWLEDVEERRRRKRSVYMDQRTRIAQEIRGLLELWAERADAAGTHSPEGLRWEYRAEGLRDALQVVVGTRA